MQMLVGSVVFRSAKKEQRNKCRKEKRRRVNSCAPEGLAVPAPQRDNRRSTVK